MKNSTPSYHLRGWAKRSAALLLLSALAATATAQQGGGMDEHGCRASTPGTMATENGASCMPVGRSGDPFVFCTEGMPQHCWVALNPLAGTTMKICKYYNRMWIETYRKICPKAMRMGHWQGKGAPNTTPFVH